MNSMLSVSTCRSTRKRYITVTLPLHYLQVDKETWRVRRVASEDALSRVRASLHACIDGAA